MIQLLSIIFLLLFMALAVYDGLYLHLWKFELFNHKESEFEHKIHTVRALLFPIIIYFLFVGESQIELCIGIAFFILDLIVLTLDAYYEKDSREFMNGLPRWEYIIHLFANSLHFAAFILIIIAKHMVLPFKLTSTTIQIPSDLISLIGINVIPGAMIMGLIHLLLTFNFGKRTWLNLKSNILRS